MIANHERAHMHALNHPIHDKCVHHTGYICDLGDSEQEQGGWTWHRTLRGAQRQRDALREAEGGRTVRIYRILSDDHTEEVR